MLSGNRPIRIDFDLVHVVCQIVGPVTQRFLPALLLDLLNIQRIGARTVYLIECKKCAIQCVGEKKMHSAYD